jgi:hypothetical protein
MQRRGFISTFSLSATAAALPGAGMGAQVAEAGLVPAQYEDFPVWLQDARAAGMDYLKRYGARDTEKFMQLLSLWATAMPAPSEPAWQVMPGANSRLEMATVAPGRPFVVSAFRMAPGCVLPLHCHPGGGGITMCTSGSVTLQHFELLDNQPAFSETGAYAEVRQVQVARVERGRATMFTPTISNLHQFLAGPEGATGYEIAVQWQGGGEFSFLRLQTPVDVSSFKGNQPLRGQWTGMQLASAYT